MGAEEWYASELMKLGFGDEGPWRKRTPSQVPTG